MPVADIQVDLPQWSLVAPLVGALIALCGVLITLWINGDRAERERRRELHARALEAVLAYREMPFMIRRRRHEAAERSAERVRLAQHFAGVQIELATCHHLLAAEGPDWLIASYERLVTTARSIAGKEAHEAWKAEPITEDSEMNMPELFARLGELNQEIDDFRRHIGWADRTRRAKRFRRGGPPAGTYPVSD